jgi:hypothetical protein
MLSNKVDRPPALVMLISGGIAGCVAKTIIAPFDRVKIHFQVQNPLLQSYSGNLPNHSFLNDPADMLMKQDN